MTINKDKLIYDSEDLENSDQVGANLVGSNNSKISSTQLSLGKEALDVFPADKVNWDEITTTFPTTSSELYTYKKNTITVQTILVTYQDSTKKVIISLNKTRL
jgi:hypothetical protein